MNILVKVPHLQEHDNPAAVIAYGFTILYGFVVGFAVGTIVTLAVLALLRGGL